MATLKRFVSKGFGSGVTGARGAATGETRRQQTAGGVGMARFRTQNVLYYVHSNKMIVPYKNVFV
jgi:hypothetical protein